MPVKFVFQAIHAYCMSVYLFPPSLGEDIERLMNYFWWGSNRGNGRGINWLRWDKLVVRKEHGGLGFLIFMGLTWQCQSSLVGNLFLTQML